MPLSVTVTLPAHEVRNADLIDGKPVEDRNFYSKGKNKGKFAIKVARVATPLFLDRDEEVTVVRSVPTREEREAYKAAYSRFYALQQVIEARAAYNDRLSSLKDAVERAETGLPRGSFYSLRLADSAGDVEAAAARFVALWETHAEVLDVEGFDLDRINALASQGRRGSGVYRFAPSAGKNADCYLDGRKAETEDGRGYYTLAPCTPEERSKKDVEPVALLRDSRAG